MRREEIAVLRARIRALQERLSRDKDDTLTEDEAAELAALINEVRGSVPQC